ncbi:MAG: hypothetical protein ACUVQL_05330 [Candidatus Bathycorpusculaceae bacterium]
MIKVFRVLQKLEVHQYPNEPRPVGGFGAGVAILKRDSRIILEKVGKSCDISPARCLSEIVNLEEASVLVGHVRMPSPQFWKPQILKKQNSPTLPNVLPIQP